MKPLIVHVAQTEINEATGMGRVAWHWQQEFERRGYEFVHLGPQAVGAVRHASLYPYAAYRAYKKMQRQAALFLVHEPASGVFARHVAPTVVVSHGVERQRWQLTLAGEDGSTAKVRLRSRLLFPLWRLRQCDLGLRKADYLLLINQSDAAFVESYYRRDAAQMHVYKNGVFVSGLTEESQPEGDPCVLFIGGWLAGKGYNTLIDAAQLLAARDVAVKWILAGTRADDETVLRRVPEALRSRVENVADFSRDSESRLLARAHIFALPSFCEGQPLSLLQAMEAGRCCVTTNCCGQRELIRHNDNGLLHERGDAAQLAALVEQAAGDAGLRKRLGKAARETVKGRSWQVVAAEVVNLLEDLMRRRRSS